MIALLFIFDVGLLVLTTLRLSRLVTSDHLGEWFIQEPAERWERRKRYSHSAFQPDPLHPGFEEEVPHYDPVDESNWRSRLIKGLKCAFCEGYWIGFIPLALLFVAGGPGDADEWWRWAMAPFALNYVVGHVSARLD